MQKPKILVFAAGSATREGRPGFENVIYHARSGTGFVNLVYHSRCGALDAHIIGVVSPHKDGEVARKAKQLKVPFFHFQTPWSGVGYTVLSRESGADFFALSGWPKFVQQLDPALTFNIHPGPLPTFGGPGMYGHRIDKAVMEAYRNGIVSESAICMHFVTKKYDEGPVFFRHQVPIFRDDTPDSLGYRAKAYEHAWQPEITNLVVHREIYWDGKNPQSLKYPTGYQVNHS